jgi:uncharacterized protein (DUF1330 family)
MPKGYVIFDETINDQAGYEGYLGKAAPTVMQHGGRALVLTEDVEVIEGSWDGKRVVVLEFDSVEAAKAWYNSAEYQAVVGERLAAADCNTILVSGFEMGG